MTEQELVERFQCPGCVCGADTETCLEYAYSEDRRQCTGHVLGTSLHSPGNLIALGLPKGFRKPRVNWSVKPPRLCNTMTIHLWPHGTAPEWNRFNIAAWAMVEEGFLFVRTYSPRVDDGCVDVIEDGTLAMVPNAIDVGQFIDEID